jgi:hypothetical protein
MSKKNRKGQSTLEYIILITAVIAVILTLVFSTASPFRRGMNSTYSQMLNSTNTMSFRLANSIM